jgi:hypothetical protein
MSKELDVIAGDTLNLKGGPGKIDFLSAGVLENGIPFMRIRISSNVEGGPSEDDVHQRGSRQG